MASNRIKFEISIEKLSFRFEGDHQVGRSIQSGIQDTLGNLVETPGRVLLLEDGRPVPSIPGSNETAAVQAPRRRRRRRRTLNVNPPGPGAEADGDLRPLDDLDVARPSERGDRRAGPRYTTPLLRSWIPWLRKALTKDGGIVAGEGFASSAGVLTIKPDDLDALVYSGVRKGKLRMVTTRRARRHQHGTVHGLPNPPGVHGPLRSIGGGESQAGV